MREIAAASDFDFVSVEPRRPAKGARGGKSRKKKTGSAPAWLSAIWRFRTPALGVAALGALLAMIVVNAVYLQHQRHPAPLFGSTFKIEPPKPPPRPARLDALLSEKLPVAVMSKVAASDAALAPPPAAAVASSGAPSAAPVAPVAAPAKKRGDAIGALLGDNGAARNVEMSADPAPPPAKTVVTAQRALQKLGASVKPDGAFGATTKKALEAFQRDNHLPVNGELTAKTRHLLAARSGLPVE
ncbi:MAG: peptidoglycan-binding domain-containing protein [Stellaceae bacterium]